MWHGLVLANEGKHSEAIAAFLDAMELGCNHWRVAWYLAKSAKEVRDVELVDKACAGILQFNPEFWFARDLQHLLGYTEWRNFLQVINKAKSSCETADHLISDHFVDVNKTIAMPKGAAKEIPDFSLFTIRSSLFLIPVFSAKA